MLNSWTNSQLTYLCCLSIACYTYTQWRVLRFLQILTRNFVPVALLHRARTQNNNCKILTPVFIKTVTRSSFARKWRLGKFETIIEEQDLWNDKTTNKSTFSYLLNNTTWWWLTSFHCQSRPVDRTMLNLQLCVGRCRVSIYRFTFFFFLSRWWVWILYNLSRMRHVPPLELLFCVKRRSDVKSRGSMQNTSNESKRKRKVKDVSLT